MGRIDDLVKQLCPDGVEYTTLGEVCICVTGGDAPSDCVKGQQSPTKEHPYPVYSNGDSVYGYCSNFKIDKEAVTVSSIGNIGTAYYREPYFTPIIRLKTFIPKDNSLNVKFLYYVLSAMTFTGTCSTLSSMKAADFKKRSIPLPPLAIQEQIVEVLDLFTDLLDNLQTELGLREKQMTYYRERLLSFEGEEVEYRSIGSLIKRKSVKASKYNSDVDVYAVTNKRGFVLSSSLHDFDIFSSDISNYNVVEADDFAYNPARLNIGSIALYKNETIGAVSPMYIVFEANKESVLPEYLMVCFRSHSVTHSIESMKEVGARFRFDFQKWERISIPIPSLARQEKIVEVLDTFTDLIDNIKQEITLRQKQYEFYREKLLTFQPLKRAS